MSVHNQLEQVKSFKYLGSIVNTDSKMEEKIKERIALGNKVYFANKRSSKAGSYQKGQS
jgi:hypothetical protein